MSYNHRNIAREEIERFIEKYKPQKVLEVGAGFNSFKDLFNSKEYFISDKNGTGDNLKIDVHELDEKDKYDCIFMTHVAEHFISPIVAWRNIYNALQSNGKVLSVTPYPCEHQIMKADPDHIFVLSPFQWYRLLHFCGFRNIKSYIQMTYNNTQIPKEQDYNIITIAEK